MANIPALPTGQAILARGKAKVNDPHQYGPGSCHIVVTSGTAGTLTASLLDAGKAVLAFTKDDGTYAVALTALDPSTVPYVNRFIADYAFVKRDWRTKTYKVQSGISEALASAVETPAAQYAPVLAPNTAPPLDLPTTVPEPEPEPVAVTVSVAPTTTEVSVTVDNAIIPAVQPLAKVKRRTIGGNDVVTMGKVTIPADDYETLLDAWNARQVGDLASVLITGPSGTAKTLMVKSFAATLGVPFIKVDGGAIRTADDWFGVLRLAQGSANYVLSPFGHALKHGIKCIVLLDEANRAETPQALNAALGLLDETGKVYVPDARETLSLPEGMLVVVTANKGAEYVGTVPFDAAVLQRFSSGIALDYPVAAVEVEVVTEVAGVAKDTAKTLVAMAGHQRPLKDDLTQFPSGTGISTRMLVDISRRVVRGTEPRKAVLSNFAAQFDKEDMTALKVVIDTYFPGSANDTLDVDVNAIDEGSDI